MPCEAGSPHRCTPHLCVCHVGAEGDPEGNRTRTRLSLGPVVMAGNAVFSCSVLTHRCLQRTHDATCSIVGVGRGSSTLPLSSSPSRPVEKDPRGASGGALQPPVGAVVTMAGTSDRRAPRLVTHKPGGDSVHCFVVAVT